jgi:hypothetical protein
VRRAALHRHERLAHGPHRLGQNQVAATLDEPFAGDGVLALDSREIRNQRGRVAVLERREAAGEKPRAHAVSGLLERFGRKRN